MQKARAIVLLLGLFWLFGRGVPLSAQEMEQDEEETENTTEDSEDAPIESDWGNYIDELYSSGDQTFTISAGVLFPTIFLNNGAIIEHNIKPPVGGVLSLAYSYFLGGHYFVGGEVGFKFAHTLGQNTAFLVPIGLRTGWQFVLHRFEFPLAFTVGLVPQRYLDYGYTGLFLKGTVSAFFRFNPDWSFGLNTDWSWYPQWPRENGKPAPAKNMDANILCVTISARYHF